MRRRKAVSSDVAAALYPTCVAVDVTAVTAYVTSVIDSFGDKRTAAVFLGRSPKGVPPDLIVAARRKLRMLDAAVCIEDLRSPPGNRLEGLRGDRAGQHSIRINDRWRICFVWRDGNAHRVEIVDYH